MSDKPKIYAFCPAGCKWETVHRDEFQKSATWIKQYPDENGVYLLSDIAVFCNKKIVSKKDSGAYTAVVSISYSEGGTEKWHTFTISECDIYRDYFFFEILQISDMQMELTIIYEVNGNRYSETVSKSGIASDLEYRDTRLKITGATAVYLHNEGASIAGEKGDSGNDGATFTPHVSDGGVLSWTNDGGKANPASVNIKGAKGDSGVATGTVNSNTEGTSDTNGYTQQAVNGLASRPNLLINPDFSINQRGASSYNTQRKYTCDRWNLYSAAGTTYNASTKTFTVASEGYFWYEQYSEIDAVLLRGKSLTFTLSASGSTRRRISFGYKVDSTKTEIAEKDTTEASTKISVTGTVPNDATGIIYVRIQGFSTTGTITLEWAKLEIGSTATAFIPPLIAEELPKCQRYYQKFSGIYSSFGSGFFNDTELACVWVKPNITMRTTATVTLNGTVYLCSQGKIGYDGTQSTEIGSNPITQNTTEKFYIPFKVSGAPTGAAIGAAMFMDDTSSLEFEAEIF